MEIGEIGATERRNSKCVEILFTSSRVTYEPDNFSRTYTRFCQLLTRPCMRKVELSFIFPMLISKIYMVIGNCYGYIIVDVWCRITVSYSRPFAVAAG